MADRDTILILWDLSEQQTSRDLLSKVQRLLPKGLPVRSEAVALPDWGIASDLLLDQLIEAIAQSRLVLIIGFSPERLDLMFQLRVAQLKKGEAAFPVASIFICSKPISSMLAAGFQDRALRSWPFQSLSVMVETPDEKRLETGLGLEALKYSAETFENILNGGTFSQLPSKATVNQPVALHIQPFWGGCGSTTVFQNQVEELVRQGYFVVRIFVEGMFGRGETVGRKMPRLKAENSTNAGAHIYDIATCATSPDFISKQQKSAAIKFAETLVNRAHCIASPEVMQFCKLADLIIANHVINLPFAFRCNPNARLLLEVHDYFTRAALERSKLSPSEPGFTSWSEIRDMVQKERALWRIADGCANVNQAEQKLISSFNAHSEIVLPRPYVTAVPDKKSKWEILIVADEHIFNIESVRWFLKIIRRDPALQKYRIAIVGRVCLHIPASEYTDLRQVALLGFVKDLDDLRSECKLTVVPDKAGTGIAIKTLTALAAGHPTVTTDIGVRGLGPDIREILPVHDNADSLVADIKSLLDNEDLLQQRRERSLLAYRALFSGRGYGHILADLEMPGRERVEQRSDFLQRLVSGLPRPTPAPLMIPFTLNFANKGNARPWLKQGWHAGERRGRWTDGCVSELELALNLSQDLPLTLRFKIGVQANTQLKVLVDGQTMRQEFFRRTGHKSLQIFIAQPNARMNLRLECSPSFCPQDQQPTSGDSRVKGIEVYRLKIRYPFRSKISKFFRRLAASLRRDPSFTDASSKLQIDRLP